MHVNFEPPKRGRPKGAKNRITIAVKDALLESFEQLENGNPIEYLKKLAYERPTVYAQLLARCIPQEISAKVEVSDKFEETLIEGRRRVEERELKTIDHKPAPQLEPDYLEHSSKRKSS